jgi:hypothetical protein
MRNGILFMKEGGPYREHGCYTDEKGFLCVEVEIQVTSNTCHRETSILLNPIVLLQNRFLTPPVS